MKPEERIELLASIAREIAAGRSEKAACRAAGCTVEWYRERAGRRGAGDAAWPGDRPREGRPPLVELLPEEVHALRRRYLQSNRGRDAGSMTMAARTLAMESRGSSKDRECGSAEGGAGIPACAGLRPETAEAILAPRASKHQLLTPVRRAMRGLEGAVTARYRDPRAGQSDGIYVPGWLRRDEETGRMLLPGERQVWDDASPNVAVAVPWAGRGDPCGDRWGWRAARYQLLCGIDCATDMFVGYGYVMRTSDGYRACDVAGVMHDTWRLQGFAPKQVVVEGGSWQSAKSLAFYKAAGVRVIDAKGRPNQKLIEGYFNKLWTAMSIYLPGRGQIGRYRGEMRREALAWESVRSGARDPRACFPTLEEFLEALRQAVDYLQRETVESRVYGHWVPREAYAGAEANGQPLPAGLDAYALPVAAERRVLRDGMVAVSAETPFEGLRHTYAFASREGWRYGGAPVIVRFDPRTAAERGARIELARAWKDFAAGTVIDAAAPCISPVPDFIAPMGFADRRRAAGAVKRGSLAAVRTVVAAYDGRGEIAMRQRRDDGAVSAALRGATPAEPKRRRAPERSEAEWAELEAQAGLIA